MNCDAIEAAAERCRGHVRETPLLSSPRLDAALGRRVLVKAECLQHTGSFKYRGAWASLSALTGPEREAGVVAYSSGNHGQAVARAAQRLGVPAVIIMPRDAPAPKIANTRAYGAEVVLYDRVTGSREALGERFRDERGLTLIKPYDAELTIAGQGTAGLEIARQAQALGIDEADVLVCCGGGGLASGIALALERHAPGLRVRPCEPAGFDDTTRSLAAGHRLANAADAESICDALLTPTPGALTFPILQAHAGPGLVVTDEDCLVAMAQAAMTLKLVLEPGGAVALAAARAHASELSGDALIVVASGGNVAPDLLATALQRHG